jgi:limonene-1,2-epoxide hydrolase
VVVDNKEVVRNFVLEFECDRLDSARVDAVLDRMAPDARYHVFAWEEPFVGRDAIRDELLRQAAFYREPRFEIVNIASIGQTVFMQRIDWATMNEKRAGFHVVGVFEVDAHGKIASWRDYVDSREIAVKTGPDRAGTGG